MSRSWRIVVVLTFIGLTVGLAWTCSTTSRSVLLDNRLGKNFAHLANAELRDAELGLVDAILGLELGLCDLEDWPAVQEAAKGRERVRQVRESWPWGIREDVRACIENVVTRDYYLSLVGGALLGAIVGAALGFALVWILSARR